MMTDVTNIFHPREHESNLLPISYYLVTWVTAGKQKGPHPEKQGDLMEESLSVG